LQMFAAMGAAPPAFAHEALLTGAEGKLSKRLGSLGVSAFREQGMEPAAIIALLARLGTSDPVEPFADPAPLIASFDFARFGRAPARFDEAELAALNQKIIHTLSFADVADRLPEGMGEAGWNAIRPNLETVAQAADWWGVVKGPIDRPELAEDDRAFAAQAAVLLAELPFAEGVWRALTDGLKAETGRKGKSLFHPLRLALTGRDHGPEMAALLPLIGRDEALVRLGTAG
jgi:glutamyl-tRNA synthetase